LTLVSSDPNRQHRRPASPALSQSSSDDVFLPPPLPRNAFLAPDFSPARLLASLATAGGHQQRTLADLRAELGDRAAAVAAELLALVDAEYASFLALGDSLRGGDERVAEARVGLLGFERGAREVREAVTRRRADVARTCAEGARVRREVALCSELLAVAEKVDLLEASLAANDTASESEDGDDDHDDPVNGDALLVGLGRLRRLVVAYTIVRQQIDRIRKEHPDIPYANVLDRKATHIRSTLVLDLGAALRLHARGGQRAQRGLIKVMKLYSDMGESGSAVEILKEAKTN
jgi:hypothetical protein